MRWIVLSSKIVSRLFCGLQEQNKPFSMSYQDHLFAGISLGLSHYGFPLECIDPTLRGDIHKTWFKEPPKSLASGRN